MTTPQLGEKFIVFNCMIFILKSALSIGSAKNDEGSIVRDEFEIGGGFGFSTNLKIQYCPWGQSPNPRLRSHIAARSQSFRISLQVVRVVGDQILYSYVSGIF
jgi:hypothetical protein